jgi:hypothetical protein
VEDGIDILHDLFDGLLLIVDARVERQMAVWISCGRERQGECRQLREGARMVNVFVQ